MAGKRGGKGKGGGRSGKGKFLLVLLVLGVLVATLVAAFVLMILRPYENRPPAPAKSVNTAKVKPPVPHYEEGGAPPTPARPEPSAGKGAAGRSPVTEVGPGREAGEPPYLAIVIDDMGYQQQLDEELLHLNLNLSFAFLPYGPHTAEQAEQARKLGRDILLHLPMEPSDHHWDPGPGALTLAMTAAERAEVVDRDLAQVPQAVGINNHMGSRFTADRAAMQDFLSQVREHHLFFLDSVTARDSLGYALAREMGVKSCRRQVFLDNLRDPARIAGQIHELLAIAERQGWAVGIGHPYPQTLEALRAARPEILRRTKLVGVSHLAQ